MIFINTFIHENINTHKKHKHLFLAQKHSLVAVWLFTGSIQSLLIFFFEIFAKIKLLKQKYIKKSYKVNLIFFLCEASKESVYLIYK